MLPVAQHSEGMVAQDAHEGLSERELEILRLVVTGVTNRQIALRLVISPNTVKVHLRNIFAKLGVESRTEAALVAIQNGWVEVPGASTSMALAVPRPEPLSWRRRAFVAVALAGCLALALWPRATGRTMAPSDALSDRAPAGANLTDPDTVQRWSSRAPLDAARERFACVSVGGLLYVIAGDTASGVVGTVGVYDPASDTWRKGADKPTPASNVGGAVLNDEVYVPGGYDGYERVLSLVEVYNPSSDTWRTVAPLPSPRCAYATAATGGRLYVIGGWDGSRYVDDVLVYDPEEDAWAVGTSQTEPRGFGAAVALDGRIYVVGGLDGVSESAVCEVYDPALEGSGTSPWKALAPMAQPRGGLGLVAAGRRLYAVGGGWNGGLAYNESYDTATNRWQPFPSPILGQWRTLGLAAVESSLGTTLYAVGGWTGDRAAVNQAYRALLNVYLPQLP
jgi:DNA-binding CsgD family transcriptional regulator